jgi:hypothetical protein
MLCSCLFYLYPVDVSQLERVTIYYVMSWQYIGVRIMVADSDSSLKI